MNPSAQRSRELSLTNAFIAFAALIIVVAGLRAAQSMLIPFVLALFLFILVLGPFEWLMSKKVPKYIAILFVASMLLAIITAIGGFLASSVNDFTLALPRYQKALNQLYESLLVWLNSRGVKIESSVVWEQIQPSSFMGFFGTTLRRVVSTLSQSIVVLIIIIFLLFEAANFKLKLQAAFGRVEELGRLGVIVRDLQHYLAIKTACSVVTGILVGLWVWAMGLDFPLLWGITAFFMNYIPFNRLDCGSGSGAPACSCPA